MPGKFTASRKTEGMSDSIASFFLYSFPSSFTKRPHTTVKARLPICTKKSDGQEHLRCAPPAFYAPPCIEKAPMQKEQPALLLYFISLYIISPSIPSRPASPGGAPRLPVQGSCMALPCWKLSAQAHIRRCRGSHIFPFRRGSPGNVPFWHVMPWSLHFIFRGGPEKKGRKEKGPPARRKIPVARTPFRSACNSLSAHFRLERWCHIPP